MPQQEAQITFLKGDEIGIETDYRDALPVNMSGIIREMFGSTGYMLETPGLVQFGTGVGIDRGGNWNERFQNHFRLSGGQFLEVDANGVTNNLGAILGADQASLPYSFETQGIIADGKFFLFSPGGGFNQVTDINIRVPIDGVWIDGYYCLTDGEFLYHTKIVAGTPIEDEINPLAIATAEFSPDPTLGVSKTTDNKWIAWNRYSTEFLRNVGGDTFAFQRIPERALKSGLVATHAKAEFGGTWFYMGGAKEEAVSVHMLQSGQSIRIASREVEKLIGEFSEDELADVVMETREEDAYKYIILHLPNITLMFNFTLSQKMGIENAWSQLATGLNQGEWIGLNGIFEPRIGKWVYGDKTDAKMATLEETSAEQYGEIQEFYLNTPFMYLETASIDELEIEIMPGHTTTKDATVFLSLSYNGVTKGLEQDISYGLPSEFDKRFIVYRIGYVANWVSLQLRGTSRSRMAFGRAVIRYG